jgi:hypothetical protein
LEAALSASYWIDSKAGLVVTKLEGVVTVEELLTLQSTIAADQAFVPTFKVLANASAVVEMQLDSAKVRRLLDHSPFKRGARRALVGPPGAVYGFFRMAEMMSENSGIETQVFLDRDEAMEWLNLP